MRAARAAKPTIEYPFVIDSVFSRHFAANGGYFTLLDMARLALIDHPGCGLPEEVKLREALKRAVARENLFVPVEAVLVPFAVLELMKANHERPQKWLRKLSPIEAAAAATARAAATAAAAAANTGGGGGGGGGGAGAGAAGSAMLPTATATGMATEDIEMLE